MTFGLLVLIVFVALTASFLTFLFARRTRVRIRVGIGPIEEITMIDANFDTNQAVRIQVQAFKGDGVTPAPIDGRVHGAILSGDSAQFFEAHPVTGEALPPGVIYIGRTGTIGGSEWKIFADANLDPDPTQFEEIAILGHSEVSHPKAVSLSASVMGVEEIGPAAPPVP